MNRKRRRLVAIVVLAITGVAAPYIAASILSKRFEPYVREQAVQYLRKRFDSEVELARLRVRSPETPPLRLLLTLGRDGSVRVEGEGVVMRHRGRRDLPPMFMMKKFSFDVDLATLFAVGKVVRFVSIDGMEINIPPKGERPTFRADDEFAAQPQGSGQLGVLIERVLVRNAKLAILPKDRQKVPLRFDIHDVRLDATGSVTGMRYDARLTNPRPPGDIHSKGTFGPWAGEEPGDTPLAGEYRFQNADLGVFSAIAGTLKSTGRFEGTLDAIQARGEATVPNFRLTRAGNPVPLSTRFEVLVDGTNGNTILKPVIARLGATSFTTSGAVIKHEGDLSRAIQLDVSMPKGDLRDLLRLAMKGPPSMEGRIFLKTRIDIPPLTGNVRDKLLLDGRFELSQGKFLQSTIQDQIDTLSRRGQGQPKNQKIDEVVSGMKGRFRLQHDVITFRDVSFLVPGATVQLKGHYNLYADVLDFHGTLALQARLSQTMTGWKRWGLKPADPFFTKQGAGTLLRIKVGGTSNAPKFSLDRK